MERSHMLIPAPSDTYISDGAPGSPLVVGGGGCEGLLPTLGACVHHPLLPQAGLQSFTFWMTVEPCSSLETKNRLLKGKN